MSVSRCPTCHLDYWRYPGAPPKGYCSLVCKDNRKKKPQREMGLVETPADVVAVIRQYLLAEHQSTNITDWYPNCAMCERLQERYAAALVESVA